MSNPIKVIKLTGVSGSLEGKADVIHDHVLSDITNAGTAASANTSDFATSAQGTKADNAIQAGTLSSVNADISDATLIDTTDSRLSDARPPTTHSHTLSQITDSGSASGLDVATVGNAAAGEVVKGNDSRLSDDRDPTAHTHTLSDISDSGTAAASDTTEFATAAQGNLATTALQDPTAFATSAQGDLADTALQDATAFAAVSHNHPLSEITDNNIVVRTTDVDVSSTSWVLDEVTLSSNSTTKVPTQASVKSYVDNEILQIDAVAQSFKGAYNALTNTPDLTSPSAISISAGDAYVVDTEGNFYSQLLLVGTTIIADSNNASTENEWTIVVNGLNATTVKTTYESNLDTNAFTDADQTKLTGIETAATADQTGAEIKTAYELEANTNAFTDADEQAVSDVIAGEYTRDDQTSVLGNGWVINDATMATATSSKLATSSSIKSYVDSLTGTNSDTMQFKGEYNATTNTPDLDGSAPREPVATGDAYIVSADGQFWTEDVTIGTLIIANEYNPSSLTGWEIISGGGAAELSELSDVTTAAVTDKFALMADGASYVGRALVEADISDLGTYSTASSTETLTNKTFDANGTGNSITNIDLTSDVIGDLPYSNLVPSTTASKLVGRGSTGAGDMQEITVGTGLTMSGTTISASGSAASNTVYGATWNGDTTNAASKNAIYDKIELLDAAIGAGGGGTVQGSSVTYDVLLASASGTAPVGTADKSVDLQAVRGASTQTSKGVSSVIGGGGNNSTDEAFAVVAGGSNNNNQSFAATISGGEHNQITGLSTQAAYSVIAGGRYNFIRSSSQASTVSGEYNEIDSSGQSSILGGKNNRITNSSYSTVSGGYGNLINTTSSGSRNVIAGGQTNEIQSSYSFVGAGQDNDILQGQRSAIVTGSGNSMSGYGGTDSCIAAGSSNTLSGYGCFIGGGSSCDIDGFFGGSNNTSIIGGSTNSAYYASNSVILGGRDCRLFYSNYTVMSGRRAKITAANKHGQFIYADDQDLDYVCNTERTANFRVANGMHISAPLFIDERASALADIAGRGQIWVKNTVPNELWFTDDAGSDRPISEGVYTVATLPTGVAGRRAFVTDSNNALSNHHGQIVAAGGANFVPVYHDGSAWHVG